MEIKTKFNIGDLAEAKDGKFEYRGYIDLINISVEKDRIHVSYHFDGCLFDEKQVYLVDREKDAIEMGHLKKRVEEVEELMKLNPESEDLIREWLKLDDRISLLSEC